MTAAAQLRNTVVGHLRHLRPGLSEQDAAAALDRAKVDKERSLRRLERHLAERGHELLIGPNTEPWPLVCLDYALHELGHKDIFRPACADCGTYSTNLIRRNQARQRICHRCYQQPASQCERCGRERPIARRGGDGQPALCNGCYQGPIMTCSRCGRERACPKHTDGKPVCLGCMPRPSHVCVECGQDRPAQAFWPIGPVCRACYAAARANPRTCPACQRQRALIAQDPSGQRICGSCGGADNDHACRQCGDAGSLYSDQKCAACVLTERINTLLAGADGRIRPQLLPIRDALVTVDRPASTLTWLNESPTATGLARLAADTRPIDHAIVDELGVDLNVRQLRAILINTGALPQRDERLQGVERWLGQVLAGSPARHVVLVRPFAEWVLLRRARRRYQDRPFTQAAAAGIRSRVLIALHFLTWLDDIQLPLAEVNQPQVDRWLDEGTTYRYALRPFIIWARGRRLTGEIEVPPLPVEAPVNRNSEQAQWEQLRRCLHDTTMPLDVRVAGSLLLLFGIRASHLVRAQADHVEHNNGNTHLRVAEHALLLPPLVAPLVIAQRDREDLRSVFGRASISGTRWLFPGLRPGRAMDPHSLAEKLNDNGINVRAARNTALAELAADLPPPVLAEFVGIGLTTATRWARYASRDWSPYLAARLHDQSGSRNGADPQ